jgi:hypothetical protein
MKQVTNEVLLEKLKGLTDMIDEKFSENQKDHARVIEQTTKTNGRVTSLEQWRWYQTGAITIISLLVVSIAIPILLKMI